MLRHLVLFFLLFIFLKESRAQSFIKGSLLDSLGKPVPFCVVGLVSAKDSSIAKGSVTSEDGKFVFENIPQGSYQISATNMGASVIFSDIVTCDSLCKIQLPPQILKGNGTNLNEVTVSTIKSPIEFKNGNIIVNVDGSPLAVGNSVFDLLSRLPGVMVVDDNILLQGNSGVRFYFDNRLQQLAGSQLISLLKSMPASSVEKIEILKVPPVKYDAAGSAGVINIVTKRVKIVGFSGNIIASYTQAYYSNGGGSFSLNYKGKKVNFFSYLNSSDDSYRRLNSQTRLVTFGNQTTEMFQHYDERQRNSSLGLNLGSDWFINSKNIIGCKVSGSTGTTRDLRSGYIDISNNDLGYDYSSFGYDRKNPWSYLNTNINFEHKLDTLGSKLLLSADYNYNDDLWTGDYHNLFYDFSGGAIIPSINFITDNRLLLNMLSAKFDLEKKLKKSWTIEGGAKINHASMFSDFNYRKLNNITQTYTSDSSLTNNFTYNEFITAGYLSIQKSYKKLNFQASIRCENTEVNTLSQTSNIRYYRTYFNLFPVATIDWAINDKNSFQISYNRRIDRPSYNQFNPYRLFRNYLVTEIGNPNLKPMYYNSFNLNYNYKGKFNTSISYNYNSDPIYEYDIQNDSTKEKTTAYINFNRRDVYVWDMFIQKNLFSWWITTLNTSLIYFTFNGNIYNRQYKASQYSYSIYNNHQFVLPRNFKIEATFLYVSPWPQLISKMQSRWNLEIGIRKNMLKDNLTLGLSCSDIFFTNIFKGSTDFANIHQTYNHSNDTRRIRLSLSYNFGKYNIRQRPVKTNPEESNRLNH